MNHEHKTDYALVRANLRKAITKIATEGLIGNLLGFAFVVFVYSLLDNNFIFNIYFVLFGSILFTIGKMIAYYLNANQTIEAAKVEDVLKDYI